MYHWPEVYPWRSKHVATLNDTVTSRVEGYLCLRPQYQLVT